MIYRLLRSLVISLFLLACNGLKLSPPHVSMLDQKWVKRQTQSTSDPSVTRLFGDNPFLPRNAGTCVCRLVAPYNAYTTVTSTYVASDGNDGLTTTTLASAAGTTPGTVEVFVPTTYSTVTTTSGTAPVFTSTVTSTLAGGSTTIYVIVNRPEFSTTTRTTGTVGATNTVATTDAAGSPTTVVVVDVPISTLSTTATGAFGYTSTVTTTNAAGSASPVVVVAEPALCGNQGWQWAYARIPLVDHGFTNDFNYATLQTATYSYIGTTDYIGINPGTPSQGSNGPYVGPRISYYGQYTDTEGQAAVNHRAYFVPPTTGTYTFRINQADDEAAIWVGASALRGYTNSNYIVETSYGQGAKAVTRTLSQYSCTPLRVIWINGSSPGGFNVTITGPSGTVLNNGDYVRNTCCNNPPPYSGYGSEA